MDHWSYDSFLPLRTSLHTLLLKTDIFPICLQDVVPEPSWLLSSLFLVCVFEANFNQTFMALRLVSTPCGENIPTHTSVFTHINSHNFWLQHRHGYLLAIIIDYPGLKIKGAYTVVPTPFAWFGCKSNQLKAEDVLIVSFKLHCGALQSWK